MAGAAGLLQRLHDFDEGWQPGDRAVRDRVADIAREREAIFPSALAANQHLTGSPVKVVEPEGRGFARAKTETDKYEQQGKVPATLSAAPVTRPKERVCLARSVRSRAPGPIVSGRCSTAPQQTGRKPSCPR